MYRISKKITFCAAHHIVGHTQPDGSPGKCSRVHGHNYELGVTFESTELMPIGFMIDYYYIGMILKSLESRWDHTDLNDDNELFALKTPLRNPTAERIAYVAFRRIRDQIQALIETEMLQVTTSCRMARVWCKETDGTEAEYLPDEEFKHGYLVTSPLIGANEVLP